MQTAYCWFELIHDEIVNHCLKLNNFPHFTFVSLSFLPHIHFTCPIPMQLSLRQCFTDCVPSEQKGSLQVQQAEDSSVILKTEPHHPNRRLHEFGLNWYCHSTICCYIFSYKSSEISCWPLRGYWHFGYQAYFTQLFCRYQVSISCICLWFSTREVSVGPTAP